MEIQNLDYCKIFNIYGNKMRLLIGGKIRNIYTSKNGSVYYKSSGENVDASYILKKKRRWFKKKIF